MYDTDIKIVFKIERTVGLMRLGLRETAKLQDPKTFAYCNQGSIFK